MSNIASLRRTDPADFAGGSFVLEAHLPSDNTPYEQQHLIRRGIIAMILMLSVWVSFHPFQAAQAESTGGDIVNQLGFGMLLILCLGTLGLLVDRRLIKRLATPSYIAIGIVLLLSVAVSSGMGASFRAMVFSVIVVLAALTIVTLPRSMSQFAAIIGAGVLASLLFSYVGLFVYPLEAIHQAGGDESQHDGLWRGVYDHKNVASAVMAVFVMIGIFTWRERYRMLGGSAIILASLFLLNSGSKTSIALLPVAMLYTVFLSKLTSAPVRFVMALFPLGILFTITVGSAVIPDINGILQAIAPGTNFTGRLDLWQYAVERIGEHPFFGYGFENFWGTPAVTNADQPIELTWDVREIVHGHNSYLDAAIAFGLPGLLIVMLVLILRPAADYATTIWQGSSLRLADLFMSIWIFTSLNACLESFFFRRADPVWFCMLISVLGLRLLATGQNNSASVQGQS